MLLSGRVTHVIEYLIWLASSGILVVIFSYINIDFFFGAKILMNLFYTNELQIKLA